MSHFIKSERGKEKLVFEGYFYVKHRHNDVGIIFWKCEKYKSLSCRGRATTQGTTAGVQVHVIQPHTEHAPSPIHIEAAQIRSNIRNQATVTRNGPRTVVNECVAGASNAAIVSLPKIVSLERSMTYQNAMKCWPIH